MNKTVVLAFAIGCLQATVFVSLLSSCTVLVVPYSNDDGQQNQEPKSTVRNGDGEVESRVTDYIFYVGSRRLDRARILNMSPVKSTNNHQRKTQNQTQTKSTTSTMMVKSIFPHHLHSITAHPSFCLHSLD